MDNSCLRKLSLTFANFPFENINRVGATMETGKGSLFSMVAEAAASIMADCGGKRIAHGGESYWWFGFMPSEGERPECVKDFDASEPVVATGDRVTLTDYVKYLLGKFPPFNYQRTGSCVNGGFWNALVTRQAIDCLVGNDAQPFALPFTLPAYAMSRAELFGPNAEGEGSTGDGMVRAAAQIGTTQFDDKDVLELLPNLQIFDIASCYSAQDELRWSALKNIPKRVADVSAPHTIEYVEIKTLAQAEAEIRKLRPFTIAGSWGSRMQMGYRGTGKNRVLFGDLADRWEHQMSCHGVWKHPELGRIWLIMQQWYMIQGGKAIPVHGWPGEFDDVPPGTFWVDDSMIQHQLSYQWGQLRSIKSLKGYDQGKLSHIAV